MNRHLRFPTILLLYCFAIAWGKDPVKSPQERFKAMGYVVVSPTGPSDGADFGPGTPGTKTSGIQEALDFAKAHKRDVYLAGGAMPKAFEGGAVYSLQETLRVPWMQDFKLDGGEAVIDYGPKHGDAIVFDSLMSCRIKLGIVVCHSDGVAIRLQPKMKGPDNFSVITTSVFEINAIVGSGSVFPGEGVKGGATGLLFDASAGSINDNRFEITEIVACDKGLHLRDGTNNFLQLPLVHLCNTHLEIGRAEGGAAAFNRVSATIDSQGIEGSVGALIFGRNNKLELNVVKTAKEKNIVFEVPARENIVTAINLPGGITNKAEKPTNRIIGAEPVGFSIETPPVPASGKNAMNRNPYTVEILILSAGEVSGWTITDGRGQPETIEGALKPGDKFLLDPGDQIGFKQQKPPQWRWRALR
ncbi:hypothetical protein HYR69_01350 [Candidatus Sumerlaeota bacterium]|nr:hypothetical protein [Candidatus Sumerlaeota bacterium]